MNYVLMKWKPVKQGYLIGGVYLANVVFVGGLPDLRPGFLFGYEYRVKKRWLIMGDFISGNHKKAQSLIGGGYNIGQRLQVFGGALFAFPNRNLQNGLVIEINWYGWNFLDSH